MTAEERIRIFENVPIREAVRRQVVPAVVSQMISLIYNLSDTYFVGLLNAPAETAAVTVAYAPFLMMTAIANLFGIGGAGAVSRALGARNERAAREISSLSFWLGSFSAAFYSAGFFLFSSALLHLVGATGDTLASAEGYTRWVIVIGGVPTAASVLLANLVRAEGNAGVASIGLSLGGVLNIFLDPFLILPRFAGFGAAGAGLATAASNFISTAFFLWFLLGRPGRSVIQLSPRKLKDAAAHLRTILSIGAPSAIQYALTVVAVAAQAKFVSSYPTQAVAALGITKKLDQLPLYFSIGVSSGLLPLLAYLHAANHQSRRREAFRFGVLISLSFSVFCFILYEFLAPQLASLLIRDQGTIEYADAFLRRMVTAMPLMSICYPMIIQFQAMKRTMEALICSVLRKGALDIPLLFLMDSVLPLYGLMWVQPIVDALSLVVCIVLYQKLKQRNLA